ncbi:MAG: peptidyl-prolyl cis-trans isomerase [Bacteroidetes bacterium]|nr:peptidyl-prolyl cis-trans isomerase [Bacteroidota bacterium]
MRVSSSLLFIVLLLSASLSEAQDPNNKILLTVNGIKVQSGEFIRMYNKSREPGKPLDVDSYLDQFITFKLKVTDVISLGLDTTRAFRNELNGYRKQLAQSYLTDNRKKEELLKKAYQRTLSEINAWHILISLPQDPSPADTLLAWEKALDIRERINQGEQFEQVARGASDDQSAKINGGNLGYFTAFQMIMPFEDAAFSLKKGGLSNPVRTPYGYHIIKVTDKRPSRGRIHVAHIMKVVPPGSGEEAARKAESEIINIYDSLKKGASFSELARTLSDHKESAQRGGELNWFGAGEMITEFAEAAFAITDTGNYSKPVRTPYGWHIIKLIEKRAPGSFDETRSFLESKYNQSYLNAVSKQELVNKLKKEYKFRIEENISNWFVRNTDTLVIQGLKKYDRDSLPEGNIYTFANQALTGNEFAKYIEKRGSMIVTRDSAQFIESSIEERSSEHILTYENSILEKKYPEFRYLMNEFHDGILLFEISGKNVWNRVNSDSTGVVRYYEEHKFDYLSEKGIEAKIYSVRMKGKQEDLDAAYLKYSGKPDGDKKILKKFSKKGVSYLSITDSTWIRGSDSEIDGIKWETGAHSFIWKGFPSVAVIKRTVDPVPLPFEKVQGEMMTGYQQKLENDWIEQLKEKYTVKVDSNELNNVKKRIANE